ncbi:translation initiation factor, partial [Striga asiatica]
VSVATTKAKKKTKTLLEFVKKEATQSKSLTQDKLLALLTVPRLRTVEERSEQDRRLIQILRADETDNWVTGKKSSPVRFGESNFPLLTDVAATKTEKKPQTLPLYDFVKP